MPIFFDHCLTLADEAQHVTKFVLSSAGPRGVVAETVLYRYPDYETRTVICCSTMSGCPVGCRFCGAGDAFVRNLTADEIMEQIDVALKHTGKSPAEINKLQIMFMSMGEPLLNLKHVMAAVRHLHARYPGADLLISTIGPEIKEELWQDFIKLSVEIPKVGLQFSIHESTNETRNKLIPFAKKWTLAGISTRAQEWGRATGRFPFVNYCATESNTGWSDAQRLCWYFPPHLFKATVSVVCERNDGMPTNNEHQKFLATRFAGRLVEVGFDVRVFDPAGQDTIGGGCGQLWYVQQWMKENPDKCRESHGTGLPKVHAPASA